MFYIFSRMDICIRSAPNYLYVLDTMDCYLPTLQNFMPLNTHPLDLTDHNSQSGSLRNDICVYGIGTFCAVGGRHRHAFFCVVGGGLLHILRLLVSIAHCTTWSGPLLPSAPPERGSGSVSLWWTFICWGVICIQSGGVQNVTQQGRSQHS